MRRDRSWLNVLAVSDRRAHTYGRSRHSSRLISSEAPTDSEPTELVFVPGVGRTSKAEEHHRRARAEASDPLRNAGWRLTNDKNLNQINVSLADVSPVEREQTANGPMKRGRSERRSLRCCQGLQEELPHVVACEAGRWWRFIKLHQGHLLECKAIKPPVHCCWLMRYLIFQRPSGNCGAARSAHGEHLGRNSTLNDMNWPCSVSDLPPLRA